ncbi:ankyrin repeat domain-containing protein 9-like [Silurus meridionalis]|uniref:ankyrin repeat domain-containing protein 9-like n=1 Tax=Silurus meridionalis TaxID=175797 RepID=UPI001EEBBA76|nr:ankyrin repeat domain-containing protein 9-like [Silurus meridionalis]
MDNTCKESEFLSLSFCQAVRDHKPVWMLEEMRNLKTFHWEENVRQQTYNPSEALLYAIVHDHRDYAQYLLNQFQDVALANPGEQFCCYPTSDSHLEMAIRRGRNDVIAFILQVVHRTPSLRLYINQRVCKHERDGKTPLHVACELLQPHTVIILLGNGASPQAEDQNGMTPLDLLLNKLWTSEENAHSIKCIRALRMCIENLLFFMPKLQFKMKSTLKEDQLFWSKILGEEQYNLLVGRIPATLFLTAMQKVLSQLPQHEFSESLDKLHIPAFLKPHTHH